MPLMAGTEQWACTFKPVNKLLGQSTLLVASAKLYYSKIWNKEIGRMKSSTYHWIRSSVIAGFATTHYIVEKTCSEIVPSPIVAP